MRHSPGHPPLRCFKCILVVVGTTFRQLFAYVPFFFFCDHAGGSQNEESENKRASSRFSWIHPLSSMLHARRDGHHSLTSNDVTTHTHCAQALPNQAKGSCFHSFSLLPLPLPQVLCKHLCCNPHIQRRPRWYGLESHRGSS